MAKVLVVGGAGYVGSAACTYLSDCGDEVQVLDSLATGVRELVGGLPFTLGRLGDWDQVLDLLHREQFDCVMHFAAFSLVSESLEKANEYYENNVLQTETLVRAMLQVGIRNLIFSSTCAIFGDPGDSFIHENLQKCPLNPYGQTKLAVETFLEEQARENGLRAISLRYFNAAGAEKGMRTGEWHEPESHLIPRVLKAAQEGSPVEVYGTDYSTPDGTCVRDYVHVSDLAVVHRSAMNRLLGLSLSNEGSFEAYNLGSENGFSVREVIQTCERVIGKKLQVIERPRRSGDAPRLVADSTLARKTLGYQPTESKLENIIRSAWEWEKKRSKILRKAVFLDRDGTLNEDPGYLSQPEQMKLFPDVGKALSRLTEAGFLLVVISNQSGVGRGLIQEKDLYRIHHRLEELLKPWCVRIDGYGLCFHRPEEECECRKPKPRMILEQAHQLQVDVSQSFFVGDRRSDILAGKAAGVKGSLLVRTGDGKKAEAEVNPGEADFVGDSLSEVVDWILSGSNQ